LSQHFKMVRYFEKGGSTEPARAQKGTLIGPKRELTWKFQLSYKLGGLERGYKNEVLSAAARKGEAEAGVRAPRGAKKKKKAKSQRREDKRLQGNKPDKKNPRTFGSQNLYKANGERIIFQNWCGKGLTNFGYQTETPSQKVRGTEIIPLRETGYAVLV